MVTRMTVGATNDDYGSHLHQARQFNSANLYNRASFLRTLINDRSFYIQHFLAGYKHEPYT